MTEAALAFAPPINRRPPAVLRPVSPAAPPRTAGMLLGRPDLAEEAVLGAVAARLAFEDRDPRMAASVLKSAMAGKPAAKALLRRLVLPAPQSSLQMPVQSILRAKPERQGSWSWLQALSFGR